MRDDFEARWHEEAEEVISGMKEWRLQHPKATFREIEQAPLETSLPEPRLCRIPVLYGGSYGPDLQGVAQYHGITEEEVVRLHCSRPYLVYLIGFMPGFPYMGELPSELITPRLKTPRLVVPAGSVAIAQRQTGIYPMDSPGGWHLLGKTPVRMFDPKKDPPSYLRMGDLVKFYPISEKEFEERNEWEGHTAERRAQSVWRRKMQDRHAES